MKPKITIEQLAPKDWKEYKRIRLDVLKKEPLYFGSSYKEEAQRSDAQWRRDLQLSQEGKKKILFFAKHDDQVIGMLGAYLNDLKNLRHVSKLVGLYVDPQFRNRGVATLLFKTIHAHLKSKHKVIKVKLHVSTENRSGIRLYKKLGFVKIGKLQKEMKVGAKYVDMYLMEKLLK